ncbi:MAG TPA: DUF4444 domain-containing protein [Aliiroseovarius sp.]|nr:DUF4444 domain-containing protein [Aliiroseovarius sp.]
MSCPIDPHAPVPPEDLFEAPRPASFPPLMQGEELAAGDPFAKACTRAMLGCDSGLIIYRISADHVRAALVLAPEQALAHAMRALPACALGLQNAIGALAPPEVAVHLGWDGAIWVNGARAGAMQVAASTTRPEDEPDWLVIGLTLQRLPRGEGEGGLDPTRTSLIEEGCGDIDPVRLLESWARHALVWLSRLEGGNLRALHTDWRGLAHGLGKEVTLGLHGQKISGHFLGIDEDFSMLLRQGEATRAIALTDLLEAET